MSVIEFKRSEKNSVAECLEEAAGLNFREVVIIGVSSDEDVYLTHSNYRSTMRLVGAIEMIKMYVWDSWHHGD